MGCSAYLPSKVPFESQFHKGTSVLLVQNYLNKTISSSENELIHLSFLLIFQEAKMKPSFTS